MTVIDSREIPWYVLYLVGQTLFYFVIVHSVFCDRYNSTVTIICIFVGKLVTSIHPESDDDLWNIIGFFTWVILLFMIIWLVTTGKIFFKIFIAIFSNVYYLIIISLLSIICPLFSGNTQNTFGRTDMYLWFFCTTLIVLIAFSFLFAFFSKLISHRIRRNYNVKYAIFFLFPMTHICYFLLFISPPSSNSELFDVLLLSTFVFTLIANFFLCLKIENMMRTETQNAKMKKDLIDMKIKYNKAVLLNQDKQDFQKTRHDLLNIISTAQGLIEIGNVEKASQILASLSDHIYTSVDSRICVNETLRVIIFCKQQTAASLNINVDFNVIEDSILRIADYDLSRILTNIIDNAIEACSMAPKHECKILITITNDFFTIQSTNTYLPEKKMHIPSRGNGTKIVKELARKYAGSYTFSQTEDYYFTKTILKNKQLNSSF